MRKIILIMIMMLTSSGIRSNVKELKYGDTNSVLALVRPFLPANPVIIDAGAWNGGDTIKMCKTWPSCTVHAFEPVPGFFKTLVHNTKSLNCVRHYQLALSDQNGKAQFNLAFANESYVKPNMPWPSGSLLKPKEHLNYCDYVVFNNKIEVNTITLDAWAEKNKISYIDFLWLDLQGYELKVLKAAPKLLKTVKAIYTEVELVEAYEGQYLYHETKDWLEKQGFTVVAQDFKLSDKSKWFGNILMVRNDI